MTSAPSLTDTQLVLLSQASQHPEGKIVPPVHLRGGVFRRVMASLAGKGLVQSAPVPAYGTMDRSGEVEAEACPVISAAGLAALGIVVESAGTASAPDNCPIFGLDLKTPAAGDTALEPPHPELSKPSAGNNVPHHPRDPRASSKQAQVLGLLVHPDGATLDALMAATGWLSHTVRAVLSGLRKRGHAIDRRPGGEGRSSRYRLTAPSLVPSCAPVASDPAA